MVFTYNHVNFVGQALDSILAQHTGYDYEICVVEDCSTDGTQDVILRYAREHPGIIRPYLNPVNLGKVDPPTQKFFQERLKLLRGDYIAILEGDDYWSSPHKLEKQVAFLEAHPEFAACAHNTVKVYEDGSNRESHRFLYAEGTKEVHSIHDFVNMTSFFHLSSIVYRNVFKANPPAAFRSKWSCDIFFTMAHVHHGKLHYMNEDMTVYRHHKGGVFSQMGEVAGRIYNIEGLRRFNRWLRYRYLKGFALSINRLCLDLLARCGDGRLPRLGRLKRVKYATIGSLYGLVYDVLHACPWLDPAVFWYRDVVPPSARRASLLAGYLK
jgi:glycosyltransferase involved in cell wall biosynthesis